MARLFFLSCAKRYMAAEGRVVIPTVRHKQAQHAVNICEWKHFTSLLLRGYKYLFEQQEKCPKSVPPRLISEPK
jgi:hypothetical protein